MEGGIAVIVMCMIDSYTSVWVVETVRVDCGTGSVMFVCVVYAGDLC